MLRFFDMLTLFENKIWPRPGLWQTGHHHHHLFVHKKQFHKNMATDNTQTGPTRLA